MDQALPNPHSGRPGNIADHLSSRKTSGRSILDLRRPGSGRDVSWRIFAQRASGRRNGCKRGRVGRRLIRNNSRGICAIGGFVFEIVLARAAARVTD
jgi:hypothetical protein